MSKCNFIYAHNKNTSLPAPIFTKLALAQNIFATTSYTKICENDTNGLVTHTKSRADGRKWSAYKALVTHSHSY
jgi:hypothetical protein